jgi:holliday junction DNA helicase RuvA
MIGFLDGSVAGRTEGGAWIDVNGVGYYAACSATTLRALPEEGERTRLWTHMYVREDQLSLFGFASQGEQRLFEALIGVNGVGPKVALHICSAFAPEALRKALVTDDVAALSSVPGIGKKTASRIVLELKEKLDLPDLQVVGAAPDAVAEARSALENLGYSSTEVREALNELDVRTDTKTEDLVRLALQALAAERRRAGGTRE